MFRTMLESHYPVSTQDNSPDALGEQPQINPDHAEAIPAAFIRKVYLLLAVQLTLTGFIVGVFTFVEAVQIYVVENPVIYWLSYVVFFVVYFVCHICEDVRSKCLHNWILQFIFILALSYLAGAISSYGETMAVFLAVAIIWTVCLSVAALSFQTKVEFISLYGALCFVMLVVVITVAITVGTYLILMYHVQGQVQVQQFLYAAIGGIVSSLTVYLNTTRLLGNPTSPEDYEAVAQILYTSTMQRLISMRR